LLAGVQDRLADESLGEMATRITFAPAGTLRAFDVPSCDAWVVRDVATFGDFIAIYDGKAAAAPASHHVFSSFDFYDQACYSSGHARGKYELDPDDSIKGTEAKFAASHELFMAQAGHVHFEGLAQRLLWRDDDEESPRLEDLNFYPEHCLDAYMVMQIVPVANAEDALSAFPNGYFSDDLTPFEIHALAGHFRAQYGYRLIAIGAACLCFLRDAALTSIEAMAVARDIFVLHEPPQDGQTAAGLAAILTGKRYFILVYVGH
jgi:hypothetical protein